MTQGADFMLRRHPVAEEDYYLGLVLQVATQPRGVASQVLFGRPKTVIYYSYAHARPLKVVHLPTVFIDTQKGELFGVGCKQAPDGSILVLGGDENDPRYHLLSYSRTGALQWYRAQTLPSTFGIPYAHYKDNSNSERLAALAVDRTGRIYVAYHGISPRATRIDAWASDGTFLTTYEVPLVSGDDQRCALEVDRDGARLYSLHATSDETLQGRVYVLDLATGLWTGQFGIAGSPGLGISPAPAAATDRGVPYDVAWRIVEWDFVAEDFPPGRVALVNGAAGTATYTAHTGDIYFPTDVLLATRSDVFAIFGCVVKPGGTNPDYCAGQPDHELWVHRSGTWQRRYSVDVTNGKPHIFTRRHPARQSRQP
jgi:hypothetical protein